MLLTLAQRVGQSKTQLALLELQSKTQLIGWLARRARRARQAQQVGQSKTQLALLELQSKTQLIARRARRAQQVGQSKTQRVVVTKRQAAFWPSSVNYSV